VAAWSGLFFLRQGVRRHRGTLWLGHVRPFLVACCAGILSVCAVLFASGDFRGDNRIPILIFSIFAAVFGLLALSLDDRRVGVTPPNRDAAPGWTGTGMLLWLGALPALVAAGVSKTGLAAAAGVSDLSVYGRVFAVVGFLLLVAGTASAAIARSSAGRAHALRGLIGQAALWGAIACYFAVAAGVRMTAVGTIEFTDSMRAVLPAAAVALFLLVITGAVLLLWPRAAAVARAAESREE
jgi:hypothetical protein